MNSSVKNGALDRDHLVSVLKSIRDGDSGSAEELMRIFLPGTRFLIERRLGKSDVDGEARSVLASAIRGVESDTSIGPEQLTRLVRQLIQQRFQAGAGRGENLPARSSAPGAEVAAEILGRMSPVEKDALRRCYVLGESAEAVVGGLKLTLEELRAIRSRARAEFSATTAKEKYVA